MKSPSYNRLKSISIFGLLICSATLFSRSQPQEDSREILKPIESETDFFAISHFQKVDIFMDGAAWDRVRYSWRGDDAQLVDGKWVNSKSDYEYSPADIVINGVRINGVGIRKKGFFGSISTQRPSLKVKLDKYIEGQNYLGMEDLTLNNNLQDSSMIRQYLSYSLFRKAGLAAPRCNLARVYVNGQYLGIYSNVEPVKKRFIKEAFGSSKGELFEGTATDFRSDSAAKFELKFGDRQEGISHLEKVAKVLSQPGEADMHELGKLIDLDQFIRFWAVEMMVGHWDGYAGNANNYFLYRLPDQERLVFLPWGTDSSFQSKNSFIREQAPKIILAKGRLCAAIYQNPAFRERYLGEVSRLVTEWWDTEAILRDVEDVTLMIRPFIHLRENEFDGAITQLKDYISNVSEQVIQELQDPPGTWIVQVGRNRTESEVESNSDPSSMMKGTVSGTFCIRFGNEYEKTPPSPFKEGSVQFTWGDEPVNHPVFVAKAGYDHPDPLWHESPKLLIAAYDPETKRTVWISMSIASEFIEADRPFRLHKSQVNAWFGTTGHTGKPLVHGVLHGDMQANMVEIEGEKYLRGNLDAYLATGRKRLRW